MFDAFWKRRALQRWTEKDALKIYRNWALYRPRVEGMQVSHMMRPVPLTNQHYTLCGWGVAQMVAARAYGFQRQRVMHAHDLVYDAVAYAPQIGCSICYDVLNDIAVWLSLVPQPNFLEEVTKTHMLWRTNNSVFADTACGIRSRVTGGVVMEDALTPQEWLARTEIAPTDCSICTAVCKCLYGVDRPEASFTKFQTLQEARAEWLRDKALTLTTTFP